MDNYVYRDRKMMKWIPFNALMEQSDYLSDLLRGKTKISKPVLSPDQEDELNYNLESAYIFQQEVCVKYFEDGDIKEADGIITKIDSFQKCIYVANVELHAQSIIDIIFV